MLSNNIVAGDQYPANVRYESARHDNRRHLFAIDHIAAAFTLLTVPAGGENFSIEARLPDILQASTSFWRSRHHDDFTRHRGHRSETGYPPRVAEEESRRSPRWLVWFMVLDVNLSVFVACDRDFGEDAMNAFEDLFVEVFTTATEEMQAFKFDRHDKVHRTLASLYATIYEEAEAAFTLYQQKKYTGAFLMQRPMIEAHVDLLNLAKDKGYIEFMEASYHHEWKKLLEAGLKGTNPFLHTFWNNADARKELDEITKRLDALKQQKIEPLRVRKRFQLANMTEEYESAYNRLCCDTHNNIAALHQRHIEIDDNGGFQIVINSDPANETVNSFLDGLCGNLLTSSFVVHEYFSSPALPKFEELRSRRDEVIKAS